MPASWAGSGLPPVESLRAKDLVTSPQAFSVSEPITQDRDTKALGGCMAVSPRLQLPSLRFPRASFMGQVFASLPVLEEFSSAPDWEESAYGK